MNNAHYDQLMKTNALDDNLARRIEAYRNVASAEKRECHCERGVLVRQWGACFANGRGPSASGIAARLAGHSETPVGHNRTALCA